MISAFVAARLMLAGSRLESYADGLKLGLWSAGGFYLGWIFVFALIPALVGAPEGLGIFLGFLLMATGHVVWTSGGLPVIVGMVGGLIYIAIKRRFMPGGRAARGRGG
jgi:hypothetical protein